MADPAGGSGRWRAAPAAPPGGRPGGAGGAGPVRRDGDPLPVPRYKEIVEVTGGRMVPDWLEVDAENLKGTVKELPNRDAIDVPVDEMLIVELYSK